MYRSDLDRLNELNFARFDAKLERRVSQLESKLEQRVTRLEANLAQLKAELDTDCEEWFTPFEVRLERQFGALRSDLLRWMFTFWMGTLLAIAGLFFAILKVR